MKKLFTLILLFAIPLLAFPQNKEAARMLGEIHGQWSLDDNGNVTYQRVVEVPDMSKDEIYTRALNYFVYNYGSGKSVIQNQDKEQGVIVGKGLYPEVHVGFNMATVSVDAWHIARVDVKEGKARIIITLTEYEHTTTAMNVSATSYTPPSHMTVAINRTFPVSPAAGQKTIMAKAFYKTHMKANETLDKLELAIREGNTSKEIENSDW